MIKTVWRGLLFLWLVSVLFVISLPWRKFDGTLHWQNIQWIPFSGYVLTRSTITEAGANALAFIPIGYLVVRSFVPGVKRPLVLATLVGLAASFSIEVYQLFCRNRVPATTDIILNTAGAIIGALAALRLDRFLADLPRRSTLFSRNV